MKKIDKKKLTNIQLAFLEACDCFENYSDFGRKLGRTAQWVHYILFQVKVPKYKPFSPINEQLALRIEKITKGKISAARLNPDLKKSIK